MADLLDESRQHHTLRKVFRDAQDLGSHQFVSVDLQEPLSGQSSTRCLQLSSHPKPDTSQPSPALYTFQKKNENVLVYPK